MILIGKSKKLALHASHLQRVERCQTLRDRKSVIELVVNDQMRRRPISGEAGGIPFRPGFWLFPEWAFEFVEGEVELFRGKLATHTKDTVVGYEGFELAAEIMTLDPIHCIENQRVCIDDR